MISPDTGRERLRRLGATIAGTEARCWRGHLLAYFTLRPCVFTAAEWLAITAEDRNV